MQEMPGTAGIEVSQHRKTAHQEKATMLCYSTESYTPKIQVNQGPQRSGLTSFPFPQLRLFSPSILHESFQHKVERIIATA